MPAGLGDRGRRTTNPALSGEAGSGVPPLQLQPRGFNDFAEQTAQAMVAQFGRWRAAVAVTGRLGRIPEPYSKGMIYGATLQDADAPDQAVSLVVPLALLTGAGLVEGDFVTATGTIEGKLYRGALQLRLRVHALAAAEPPRAQERRREAAALLGALRGAGGERRPFPMRGAPSVALIAAASPLARVREDFKGALRGVEAVSVRDVTVAMDDPAAIAAALRNAQEDVVALVRGGGDDREFMVFEAQEVLAALGECRGFRLLGLGHSGNRTLADCVADHAAPTPADAGRFVRERVLEARRRGDEARRMEDMRRRIAVLEAGPARTAPADVVGAPSRPTRKVARVLITVLCAFVLAAAILLLAR